METITTLLNLCPVPMVMVDDKDNMLFTNESFTRLFGYDLDDLPDLNHWFALAYRNDEYRRERERVWEEASSQLRQKIDFNAPGRLANITYKDGSIRIVEIYGANMGEKIVSSFV
jgi:PAS domain S-box-containing protein